MERKNLWQTYSEAQIRELEEVNAQYRTCLDEGKTERECVKKTIELAEAEGYRNMKDLIKAGTKIHAGDKVYMDYMGKAIVLFQAGTAPVEEGMNILGAHIDSPRIDVKQNPLYENEGLAYLDTHYYGGVKKYQWLSIPLALHGVIVKKNGEKVEVCVGEKETDPVLVINDLLPHLGARQREKLAKDFKKKFGKPVQEGYGLSEASPVCTVNPAAKIKVGSIGPQLPNVTVEIRDEADRKVPDGTVGELCARGDNVMLGYLNRPEETAVTLRGGWLHTGDLAYQDEEGYIFIVDRLKDMIITGGENVYPREVEEALYHHPAVQENSAVGVPDKLRGQAVCAYVVLKEGQEATKPQLRRFLMERLAGYKVPKYFFFCEQLPKNGTGKVLKTALREKAIEDLVNRQN